MRPPIPTWFLFAGGWHRLLVVGCWRGCLARHLYGLKASLQNSIQHMSEFKFRSQLKGTQPVHSWNPWILNLRFLNSFCSSSNEVQNHRQWALLQLQDWVTVCQLPFWYVFYVMHFNYSLRMKLWYFMWAFHQCSDLLKFRNKAEPGDSTNLHTSFGLWNKAEPGDNTRLLQILEQSGQSRTRSDAHVLDFVFFQSRCLLCLSFTAWKPWVLVEAMPEPTKMSRRLGWDIRWFFPHSCMYTSDSGCAGSWLRASLGCQGNCVLLRNCCLTCCWWLVWHGGSWKPLSLSFAAPLSCAIVIVLCHLSFSGLSVWW